MCEDLMPARSNILTYCLGRGKYRIIITKYVDRPQKAILYENLFGVGLNLDLKHDVQIVSTLVCRISVKSCHVICKSCQRPSDCCWATALLYVNNLNFIAMC